RDLEYADSGTDIQKRISGLQIFIERFKTKPRCFMCSRSKGHARLNAYQYRTRLLFHGYPGRCNYESSDTGGPPMLFPFKKPIRCGDPFRLDQANRPTVNVVNSNGIF